MSEHQTPQSGRLQTPPAGASEDPLASRLLPVLLHKLNNATQLLTGLNSLLAMPNGEAFVMTRGDDFGKAAHTVDELGWALAVIATASGSNMLLERREARGLTILCGLTADALRRRDMPLINPAVLPELEPSALDGWQVPWAICALLCAASEDRGPGAPWAWELDQHGAATAFRMRVPAGDAVAALLPVVRERLPGALCEQVAGNLQVDFPAGWLRPQQAH